MAIQKKPYEISVWHEELTGVGQKTETKLFVIGAHDMDYLGRAIRPKLITKINGTHELSFDMVDSYFDSQRGKFVKNDFIDDLFAEQKIKLYYKNKWYEFYIKSVQEKGMKDKDTQSYLKTYTCRDAFIDELSRNGYGLTFDEELYNNVEEIGVFSEEILDDSVWYYSPQNNWGDFTEIQEEKLFKVPISLFGGTISGYKFNFALDDTSTIENVYTGDTRPAELSDDLARVQGKFWDNYDNTMPLKANYISNIDNDGFIYIPYSCLDFCYTNTDANAENIQRFDRAATEVAVAYPDDSQNRLAIAPPSVNPLYLIQFICVPAGEEIEVDESGLIVDKKYCYFMTLRQWNEAVVGKWWYIFKDTRYTHSYTDGSIDDLPISHTFKYLSNEGGSSYLDTYKEALGNKIVYYDGYASEFAENGLVKGKKISVADRSEVNISEEIDSYATVYNNKAAAPIYKSLYTNEDWPADEIDNRYRICSVIGTRQIVPQLARNYIQNGIQIKSIDGWDIMQLMNNKAIESASIKTVYNHLAEPNKITGEYDIENPYLYFKPCQAKLGKLWRLNVDLEIGDVISLAAGEYIEAKGSLFFYKNAEGAEQYQTYDEDGIRYLYWKPIILEDDEMRIFKRNEETEDLGPCYIDPWINPLSHTYGYFYDMDGDVVSQEINVEQKSLVNFGAVSQGKKLEKDKIYCIGFDTLIQAEQIGNSFVRIAEGSILSDSSYTYDAEKCISFALSSTTSETLSAAHRIWQDLREDNTIFSIPTKSYFMFLKVNQTIENPYFIFESNGPMVVKAAYMFEAYTKGIDQFEDSDLIYRYSGRDITINNWKNTVTIGDFTYFYNIIDSNKIRNQILFEDDIMPGDTYAYQKYYIQRLKLKEEGASYDTMGVKEFISTKNIGHNSLPLDGALYTDQDYEIQTNYINLNNCPYYKQNSSVNSCDCCYGGKTNKTCMYQREGYCPYLFESEKHPRKVRTLKGEKSNRFNLIQELGKIFKVYPMFYTNNDSQGYIQTLSNGIMDKRVFFITEKGKKNDLGFRYAKNLSSISRTIKSEQIVTKLYVQDVDSEFSRTGLCSIKTAEDNPTKDSFVIDFSYYIAKGMLDANQVEKDLYGLAKDNSDLPQGYLKQLGYYNTQYDLLSNKIINLQNASFNELEANVNVNLEGIETAIKQLRKINESLDRYKGLTGTGDDNPTYKNYQLKYAEQQGILQQLIVSTFQTDNEFDLTIDYSDLLIGSEAPSASDTPIEWLNKLNSYKFKEYWLTHHEYSKGILGQYNRELLQIEEWKKERSSYLKQINKISSAFFKKYEPFLKEGTWSDSNYLTDNAYYHGSLEVAAEGAIPKVQYSINVSDIAANSDFKDYEVEIADTTFVEDTGMFGYNKKTGLPNHLKVLVSSLTEQLDTPSKNTIGVQNFTTQFEDLFQQVTASVQSLTLNENIYHRASNFTSLHHVEKDSLQGTLNSNDFTFIKTAENNIQLDAEGQKGSDLNNHTSQYKLNGQGLFFSNNGGQSWDVGVGPNGINADYIKAGTLDSSKVRIADSGYIYFSWDKDGIFAYRDPSDVNSTSENSNDYAVFNRYGLSIVRDGKIRLRSGYSFTGTDGEIKTENELGKDIGFFLYNKDGNIVLRNYTSDVEDGSRTARLAMQGEMFVTDQSIQSAGSQHTSYTFSQSIYVSQASVYNLQLTIHPETILVIEKLTNVPYVKFNGLIYHGLYREITIDGISYFVSKDDFDNKITTYTIASDVTLYKSQSINSIRISDMNDSGTAPYTSINNTSVQYDIFPTQISTNTEISSRLIYYINNTYYKHLSQSSSGLSINGIGIYLNNQQAYSDSDNTTITVNHDKRILSCVSKNIGTNSINNILTILRNGNLFIGGEITEGGAEDISNLADVITISNEKIRLQSDGKIYLDFSNMYNTGNGNIDLITYIRDQFGAGLDESGLVNHFHFFTGNWGYEVFGTWNSRDIGWYTDAQDKDAWLNSLLTLVADLYRGMENKFLSTLNGTNTV